MHVRLTTVFVAVIAGAAIAVGCGGSEGATSVPDSAEGSSSALTKAEFIKQANTACEEERAGLAKRIADFERRRGGRKPGVGSDMVHFVYLPTIEAQIFRIEQLGAPRGDLEKIEGLLDAERYAVDAVAVIPRVPSLTAAERRFAEADRLLRAYGLSSCANDPPKDKGA